jgi:thiol:disulfide interchange protein DsbD
VPGTLSKGFDDTGPYPTGTPTPESVAFDLFGWTFSIGVGSAFGRLLLLLTAALGGVLLNFTPCVLPLVPIKIMSLSHAADQNRLRCLMLGTATFFGVLVFWLLLGAVVAGASEFTATNQLFQYPLFTLTVGVIIAVMAFGMFGTFSMRLPGILYRFNPDQESLYGSFALGILTAVLSTPCTAPFMGAAAAWAVTQTPATTLATFTAVGMGMALPYLLLSARPELVRGIPRSGPASVLVKEMMGWFLLAAAAYFLGSGISALTIENSASPSRIYWWVVACLVGFSGGWLAFRTFRITRKTGYRVVFGATGVLLVILSLVGGWRLTDPGSLQWVSYTPQRLEQSLSRGRTVVLVFTAEWCLNCKALEQGVLRDPRLESSLSPEDVVPMRVDITGDNPEGKRKLAEMGSVTIPLLSVVAPDGTVVFQSDFYTAEQVLRAVETARDLPKR